MRKHVAYKLFRKKSYVNVQMAKKSVIFDFDNLMTTN